MLGFHVGSPSDGLSPQARDMPITQKNLLAEARRFSEWGKLLLLDVLEGIQSDREDDDDTLNNELNVGIDTDDG